MTRLEIRVPGKVILSGEHSVVYGYEAVVAAVNRFVTISISWEKQPDAMFFRQLLADFSKKNIIEVINAINGHIDTHSVLKLESEIPLGCGMGSSASLASGLSLLCLILAKQHHDLDEINKYAYLLEKQVHANPSGVDNTIVTRGGILKYRKMLDGSSMFSTLPKADFLDKLYLVNTGKPSESTGQLVQKVRISFLEDQIKTQSCFEKISQSTESIINCLMTRSDDQKWREAISQNEDALEQLGVVSDSCIHFIMQIKHLGGVAKVSGAGGYKTNSGIVLVYPGDDEKINQYLEISGFDFSPLSIDGGITYQITK